MTITVHHLEHSRSQRILWLLEELGLPYQIRSYQRMQTRAAPDAMKAIHPLGKAPIIEDDGLVIAETGAIIEYLVEKAGGRLGPPTEQEHRLRYRYFLHYAEGSVMTALLMSMVVGTVPVVDPVRQRRFQPMVTGHLDFIEAEIASRPWFAGEQFSAADVMMSFPIEFAAKERNGLEGRPATAAWLDKIHARPAYRAAIEAGGPYRFT
jgi:glutathione S-transferase